MMCIGLLGLLGWLLGGCWGLLGLLGGYRVGRTPSSAADPLVGLFLASENRCLAELFGYSPSIGDDFRTIMRRTSPSSSLGASMTVCPSRTPQNISGAF
jgi:hypothetical protein